MLYAVLGTAVTAHELSEPLLEDLSREPTIAAKVTDLSERYRSAALKCLEADNYLWQHDINSLQALIVLNYGINHSHGQTWSLLGLTYHIALSLGCHVDPSEFELDVIKSEERRRCWAGVMMLYMLQNTSLGHLGPDPRHASNGVRLPADVNDADLRVGEWDMPASSGVPTQMSYLLLKFRLYDVSSDICSLVLNASSPTTVLIDRMDNAIQDERRLWSNKYLEHSNAGLIPAHHQAHLNILYGYSHQMTLLLHHQAMRYSTVDSPRYIESMGRCFDSARDLLRIHERFFNNPQFSPFGWYLRGIGSFHAFHAAVSLITVIASHPWEGSYGDAISAVKDCAARFDRLNGVSLICDRASPVLRFLM